METATRAPAISTRARYIPRGRNQLHTIFDRHLDEFCDVYDEKYAAKYGMFRLERIRDIGERFLTCRDYRLGLARIRCTIPGCGHDYFSGADDVASAIRPRNASTAPIGFPIVCRFDVLFELDSCHFYNYSVRYGHRK